MLNVKELKKKSLNYSIVDACFYAIMLTFGEYFISPYALSLGVKGLLFGLLGTLPLALGYISQLFTNKILNLFGNRKKPILIFAAIQGFCFALFLLADKLAQKGIALLIFVIIYWVSLLLIGPLWTSWMGDLTEEKTRGSYFGKRNKLYHLTKLLFVLIPGLILAKFNDSYEGFVIIFMIAMFARMLSVLFLSLKYEPKVKIEKSNLKDFSLFLRDIKKTDFGRLVIFLVLFNFAYYLASPFFVAYLIDGLGYTSFFYTIFNGVVIFSKVVFMPIWGRAIDKYGNRKVLLIATTLVPFLPLIWILSRVTFVLVIVQILTGFILSAFELSVFSIMFDVLESSKRAKYISYYNVVNGIFMMISSAIAGLVLENMVSYGFMTIFLISFIFGLIVKLKLSHNVKELREVKHISSTKLIFNILGEAPSTGINHVIMIFKKKKWFSFDFFKK